MRRHGSSYAPVMDWGAAAFGVAVAALIVGAGAASYTALSRAGKAGLIVGSIAHVAVSIPENGVGIIALVVGSRRTTLPARSPNGGSIPRSTEVVVIDVRGRIAVVSPLY